MINLSSSYPRQLNAVTPAQGEPAELRMLPRLLAARVAVWSAIVGFGLLTFAAWLRPNMVFDLANMVFCL